MRRGGAATATGSSAPPGKPPPGKPPRAAAARPFSCLLKFNERDVLTYLSGRLSQPLNQDGTQGTGGSRGSGAGGLRGAGQGLTGPPRGGSGRRGRGGG